MIVGRKEKSPYRLQTPDHNHPLPVLLPVHHLADHLGTHTQRINIPPLHNILSSHNLNHKNTLALALLLLSILGY